MTAAMSMRAENLQFDERTGSRRISCTGAMAKRPMLSWGQALTQSMHSVQSMFPAFCGIYSCSSHPRCCAFPAMQSWVVQRSQVEGDTSEPAKLNCPSGQMYLQKFAPRKKVSTRKAAAK